MSAGEVPQVIQVPVKKHEVNLTLDDFVTALSEKTRSLAQAGPGAAPDPEVVQHLQQLSELASQLKDVVSHINQIDPTLLTRLKQGQSPST
jgi:hypothetical protein